MSKSYSWYCGRKKRIKKKYTLILGSYISPKELKVFYRVCKLRVNRTTLRKIKKELKNNV